jgi:outer membrane receptor for ferrienterochelin and colicins
LDGVVSHEPVAMMMTGKKCLVLMLVAVTIQANAQDTMQGNIMSDTLKEISIQEKRGTRMDVTSRVVELITASDLLKDACCNLSESFENSASVDANYTDAVSGARQIRLLGLDGLYTQFTLENMPSIRGLQNAMGLSYVPGPWMSSIQINKGAGSVVNGYESMAGQINVEYKKPQTAEKFFTNLYINQDVRTELNLYTAYNMKNSKWSGMSMVHGLINWLPMDFNKDGFVDNPLVKQVNAMQRFTYMSGKKFNFISAANVTLEDRRSGQLMFNEKEHVIHNPWKMQLKTVQANVFAKTGFVLNERSSIGLQYKYNFHDQQGTIGSREYKGREHYGYFNTIYQNEVANGQTIKMGLSFQADNVLERLDTFKLKRMELVPGAFVEGSFNFARKVDLVVGIRVDHHNLYGTFFSPRLNLKWNIIHDLSLRLSGGRGYRVSTVFAEHFGFLANNRIVALPAKIQPEIAWNYGASVAYKFFLNYREGLLAVDFFRTDFTNQLVTDIEDPARLSFYNLKGKSYSNSLNVELNYEPVKRFDIKLAYRFEDVKTTYGGILKQVALRPRHKGLVSLEYKLKNNRWRFNTHLTIYSKPRVPQNDFNTTSKNMYLVNAQITYTLKKFWEFYVGGENILNQTQAQPIIGLNGYDVTPKFDASLVWGQIRGAMVFAGFRFQIGRQG